MYLCACRWVLLIEKADSVTLTCPLQIILYQQHCRVSSGPKLPLLNVNFCFLGRLKLSPCIVQMSETAKSWKLATATRCRELYGLSMTHTLKQISQR